jgi:hypothetical protein
LYEEHVGSRMDAGLVPGEANDVSKEFVARSELENGLAAFAHNGPGSHQAEARSYFVLADFVDAKMLAVHHDVHASIPVHLGKRHGTQRLNR